MVVGPFAEEEEGTGVASDVVKVKDEDPATPGPLKRIDPGTVTIPQYRVNKTKQHTLYAATHCGYNMLKQNVTHFTLWLQQAETHRACKTLQKNTL